LFSFSILRQQLEKRSVPKVLFQVGTVIEIEAIDFGNGKTMPAKMAGEFQESDVLLAHAVKDADRALAGRSQADDLAPRPAEFALHRQHPVHRHMEMLFE